MTKGILIIHGFGGGVHEIMPLKNKLENKGYKIETPTLAGHGKTKKDLRKVGFADWINSAKEAFFSLKAECEKVVVVGFSMGGLIGVNLCVENEADKLILVNTPYYYWNFGQVAKNLKADFFAHTKNYYENIKKLPLSALVNFKKLLTHTKGLIPRISCPIYIIQTLDDDTVKPKSADFIYNNIKGEKHIIKYERGGHLALLTNEKICEDIEKII